MMRCINELKFVAGLICVPSLFSCLWLLLTRMGSQERPDANHFIFDEMEATWPFSFGFLLSTCRMEGIGSGIKDHQPSTSRSRMILRSKGSLVSLKFLTFHLGVGLTLENPEIWATKCLTDLGDDFQFSDERCRSRGISPLIQVGHSELI